MSNIGENKEQLLSELEELRRRVVELETLEHERQRTQNTLEASLALIQKSSDLSAELFMQCSLEEALKISYDSMEHRVEERTVELNTSNQQLRQEITERQQAEEALRESEGKFRSLYASITHGIALHEIIYDASGKAVDYRILDVNLAYETITGLNRERVIGSTASELYRMKKPPYLGIYAEVAASRKPTNFEIYFPPMRKHFSITAFSSVEGQFATIFTDISERKQTEDALRQSEQWLNAALERAKMGIWEINTQTGDGYWSKQMYDLYGRDPSTGEPTLEEYLTLAHPDDRHLLILQPPQPSDGLGPFSIDHRTNPENGPVRHLNVTVHTFEDRYGHNILTGTVLDVTERKQAEKEHLELVLEKERIHILRDFITKASHEFKTPLATINASAYLLDKATDSDQKEQYIRKINDQVQAVTELVNAMTTMSRLDVGEALTFSEVDLNEIICLIRDSRQVAFREKNINLVLHLYEKPLLFQGDQDYLGDAVSHILDNAIQHTPDGGTIIVRSDHIENNILLELIDSGPGIGEEHLPHVFERFYRADRVGTTRGFGLGLPIAKTIIERHGGRIEIESEDGKGSTFRILLPTV